MLISRACVCAVEQIVLIVVKRPFFHSIAVQSFDQIGKAEHKPAGFVFDTFTNLIASEANESILGNEKSAGKAFVIEISKEFKMKFPNNLRLAGRRPNRSIRRQS